MPAIHRQLNPNSHPGCRVVPWRPCLLLVHSYFSSWGGGSLVKERAVASTFCFPSSVSQPRFSALQLLLPMWKSAMPTRRNGPTACAHPLLSSPVHAGGFVCFYGICHFSSWRQWRGWLLQTAYAVQEVEALIYLMLLKHRQTTKQINLFLLSFQRE